MDDLPALISRTHIQFQSLVERALAEVGLQDILRPGMAPVLFALYEKDDCIIKDLAHSTHRSASALNSLLGRLEKCDVVTLRRCEKDGRAVRVRLTPKGWEIERQVHELHRRVSRAVTRGLAEAETTAAATLLRRIIAGMEADATH